MGVGGGGKGQPGRSHLKVWSFRLTPFHVKDDKVLPGLNAKSCVNYSTVYGCIHICQNML